MSARTTTMNTRWADIRAGRHSRRWLLGLGLALALVPAIPQPVSAGEDAAACLQRLSRQAVARLGDTATPTAERHAEFRAMLEQHFDVERITRFILGRYWRGASQADRDAFRRAFVSVVSHRFLPLFEAAREQGTTIDVSGTRPAPNRDDVVVVQSRIALPGSGQSARVGWRIQRQEKRCRILDVTSEGVSMVITLRSEYSSVLERNGGNVGALAERLQQVADEDTG